MYATGTGAAQPIYTPTVSSSQTPLEKINSALTFADTTQKSIKIEDIQEARKRLNEAGEIFKDECFQLESKERSLIEKKFFDAYFDNGIAFNRLSNPKEALNSYALAESYRPQAETEQEEQTLLSLPSSRNILNEISKA